MNTLIMAASYLAGSAMVVQKMLSLKDFRKTLNSNEILPQFKEKQ